jgi:hypothetical protein
VRLVNQPTGWWGWHWEPPVPLSIVQIIAAGSMSPRLASLLWLAMERGASVIVASSPPGAGKTVTLTALLAFTPPETVGYFTRGVGETFSLPPLSPHGPTYILVNELSDHLPVYTWGPYARKVFELMAQGYSLASTMHADTVEEVLDQLAELGIPPSHLASLDLVITLYVGRGQGRALVRRVREVAFIQQEDQGYRVLRLARWCPEEDTFQVAEDGEARRAFLSWAGLDEGKLEEELRARSQFLESLLAQGVVGIPQVAEAIAAFHRP